MADSGGDSNTSTCEREVIERLLGGFVEDIIFYYVSTARMDQETCRVVVVFRYAGVVVSCWLLLSGGGSTGKQVGDNRDHLRKAKNEGQKIDRQEFG